MKKILLVAVLAVFVGLGITSIVYAVQDTDTVNVSCSVATGFDMTMLIKDSLNNTVSAMDFGPLVHVNNDPNEPFISSKSFNVWLSVNSTNAKQYKIKQAASQLLTSGTNTIPQNAFVATTITAGSTLNGGSLNQADTMVGVTVADRELFTSSAAGGAAQANISYGITTENGAQVPKDQAAGTYSATLTYTAYEL